MVSLVSYKEKPRLASKIAFSALRYFSKYEFPAGVLDKMNANVILELNRLRERCPNDYAMTPSPLSRAHVRTGNPNDTSRHSTQGGKRLSDATDIFMDNFIHALYCWNEAKTMDFGGIGLYFTKWIGSRDNVKPMLHFDMREIRVRWICVESNYYYDDNNLLIIDRIAREI